MSRKLSLPLLSPRPAPPSVDVIRKRLGGRASTESGAGEVVTFATDGGIHHTGVVIFVSGDDLDVYVNENLVRRVRRSLVKPTDVTLVPSFVATADSARIFGDLSEGQRVQFADGDSTEEGILIEKCRFGALVKRMDGRIAGLGFRRIWPAPNSNELPS